MEPTTIIASINLTFKLIKEAQALLKNSKIDAVLNGIQKWLKILGVEGGDDLRSDASSQRDLLVKLAEQVKINQEVIEKQNKILESLAKSCEQVELLAKESQKRSTLALIFAACALILAVVLLLLVR